VVSLAYCVSLRGPADWRGRCSRPGLAGVHRRRRPLVPGHLHRRRAGFFQSFFLDHNVGRYGGVKHGHAGFPGYYFVMLPLVLLPFTGWFLRLLPMARPRSGRTRWIASWCSGS
jgi:4-amino-4-deoxy-L-arabinose transferase-like glycosyltransferase